MNQGTKWVVLMKKKEVKNLELRFVFFVTLVDLFQIYIKMLGLWRQAGRRHTREEIRQVEWGEEIPH
jgi:hypothetical protein